MYCNLKQKCCNARYLAFCTGGSIRKRAGMDHVSNSHRKSSQVKSSQVESSCGVEVKGDTVVVFLDNLGNHKQ